MVTAVDHVEGGPLAQAVEDGPQKLQVGQAVTGPLNEEHGDLDSAEVVRSIGSRAPGRVEREAEEDQTADARQG